MNLKLYGICFSMRGFPDLLESVQTNTPVPVGIMDRVLSQMDSVSREEMEFAKTLETDWKKAFNEKVPMAMSVAPDGGYDISCSVPDELLATVRMLRGIEDEEIVGSYTADYLKKVCGLEVDIVSVDVDRREMAAPSGAHGFDLGDLDAGLDEPAFEDVSQFMAAGMAQASEPEDVGPAYDDPGYGEPAYEEPGYEEPGYEEPEYGEPAYGEGQAEDGSGAAAYISEVANIYRELVTNIRERKLDERLGLVIGA